MEDHRRHWELPVLTLFLLVFAPSVALIGEAPSADKVAVVATMQAGEYAGGDMCFTCHDIEDAFRKNPHYKTWEDTTLTWSERGCETCHGPGQAHIEGGGDVTQIFRFKDKAPNEMNERCLDCHLKQEERASFMRNEHGLNSVACTECHSIHSPQVKEGLLIARTPALCYDCHGEVRAQFNKPFRHRVHEGLISCTDCHNQHGGFNAFQYRNSTGNDFVCYECHGDKQGPFVFEHAVVKVEGCSVCHEVHGSVNPRMLKRSEVRFLCMECHSATPGVESPSPPGFHNVAIPEWQSCTSCHSQIHGSNISPVFFE